MSNLTCVCISAATRAAFFLSRSPIISMSAVGHDLPSHAELVDDPAAGHFLAAVFQYRLPVAIDLRLRAAVHAERDGVVERMMLAGAHGEERLTKQAEFDAIDRAASAGQRP